MAAVIVIAASPSEPTLPIYAPLGVAGVVCTVLTWVWLRAERRADRAEERERANAARYEEKLERFVPMLTEASLAFKDTHRGMLQADRDRLSPGGVTEVLDELATLRKELKARR